MFGVAVEEPPEPAVPGCALSSGPGVAIRETGETNVGFEVLEGHHPATAFFPTYKPGSPSVREQSPTRNAVTSSNGSKSPHNRKQNSNDASTPPMLDPDAQISIIQTWMAAVRQVASLRESILTARMDVKRERTRCYQQEEFFDTIMNTFMALLKSATMHGNYPDCKDELDNLSQKMETSSKDLKLLRQRSSGLEDGLSNQEYRLTKLEKEIYQELDTEFRLGSLNPASPASYRSQSTQKPLDPADTETTQTPRDELYERMADLRILLDRLNDFEYDLRQELDERDMLRAAGHIALSSDTVFFEETRAERAKLQTELEECQADVERLKQLCIRQGIVFEDIQFHNPFHDAALETYSAPSTQEGLSPTLPLPQSSTSLLSSLLWSRDRVRSWLMSSAGNLGNGPAEQETGRQPRRESCSDASWVLTRSWPRGGRPSSAPSQIGDEAHRIMPQWTLGPPPGSIQLAALPRESTTDDLPKQIRRGRSHTTP